jgi:hypothetical protein
MPLLVRATRFGLAQAERPFRWLSGLLLGRAVPWLKGAYLTLRYVDTYREFPAIRMTRGAQLRIRKEPGAQIHLATHLRVEFQAGRQAGSSITLQRNARLEVGGPFHIGEDVRILVARRGLLEVEGGGPGPHGEPSYSGMMGHVIVQVKQHVRIGQDTGLSWHSEVMDSDWHPVDGRLVAQPVDIGRHVWVAPGTYILKGARIGDDCIVASKSTVLAGAYPPRSFLAGTPAKVLGPAPTWRYEWHETDYA